MDNKRTMDKAKIVMENLLRDRLALTFFAIGREILNNAETQREYRNLTGNTLTSISFGYYENYVWRDILFINGLKSALRNKLHKGEVLTDYIDYDGNFRQMFLASQDTDGSFGQTTALNFLKSYKPQQATAIVVTTGTEYSEFLENELNLNVLTDTVNWLRGSGQRLFLNNFKRI